MRTGSCFNGRLRDPRLDILCGTAGRARGIRLGASRARRAIRLRRAAAATSRFTKSPEQLPVRVATISGVEYERFRANFDLFEHAADGRLRSQVSPGSGGRGLADRYLQGECRASAGRRLNRQRSAVGLGDRRATPRARSPIPVARHQAAHLIGRSAPARQGEPRTRVDDRQHDRSPVLACAHHHCRRPSPSGQGHSRPGCRAPVAASPGRPDQRQAGSHLRAHVSTSENSRGHGIVDEAADVERLPPHGRKGRVGDDSLDPARMRRAQAPRAGGSL